MNCIILIGRLSRDTELSYTPNTQTAVCRFGLAVQRERNREEADFFNIKAFGRTAETCDRYLGKGSLVAIRGRAETGSYTNKVGVKVNYTEIIADNVKFLDSAPHRETPVDVEPEITGFDDWTFSATNEKIPF